jgi:4-hydroxybenzoate polyprenyltransferase
VATVIARSYLRRKGRRPERVAYIAIFGLSYCAVAALINLPPVAAHLDDMFFNSYGYASPMEIVYRSLFRGMRPLVAQELGALLVGATLAGLAAASMILGAWALFQGMRAPRMDPIAAQERARRLSRAILSLGRNSS